MSAGGRASESLPSGPALGEKKDRVSDDQKPPAGDGIPPVPRPRSPSKRQAQRRDWLRSVQRTPPTANPAIIGKLAGLLSLVGILVAFAIRFHHVEPEDSGPDRLDLIKTGTSAAAVALREKDQDENHALAEELFGPELFEVKDWTDLAEEPQWRRAVEVMAKLDPQFIDEHLSFKLNRHFEDVMADPAAYRGRFVRMHGVVAPKSYGAKKLEKPIAGRIDTYRGQVTDDEVDSPMVFFDVLDRPADFDVGYDEVDIDGIFYRTVTFESRDGKTRKCPWIVGRTVNIAKKPVVAPPSAGIGPAAALTAFLAIVIAIVYLVRRGRPAKAPAGARPAGFRRASDRKISPERPEEPPPPPFGGE
jgi:hypothetical protein